MRNLVLVMMLVFATACTRQTETVDAYYGGQSLQIHTVSEGGFNESVFEIYINDELAASRVFRGSFSPREEIVGSWRGRQLNAVMRQVYRRGQLQSKLDIYLDGGFVETLTLAAVAAF